uniref:Uncharacterized protein n=1 Tax=Rhizophora mucronata TaxID=61149 RepID=A0A2P2ISL1_RHIMU
MNKASIGSLLGYDVQVGVETPCNTVRELLVTQGKVLYYGDHLLNPFVPKPGGAMVSFNSDYVSYCEMSF